jgi:hypothetical protein
MMAVHASHHQQVSLRTLFPFLSPGGLCIVEDLSWQPQGLEASLPPVRKARDLLRGRTALSELISSIDDVMILKSCIQVEREDLGVIVKGPSG